MKNTIFEIEKSFLFLATLPWMMTESLESLNRKVSYVCTTLEGRYKLVETASKKEVFTVIRMKDRGFASIAQGKHKLVFHRMTTGEKV
jgi:hypothetical protein